MNTQCRVNIDLEAYHRSQDAHDSEPEISLDTLTSFAEISPDLTNANVFTRELAKDLLEHLALTLSENMDVESKEFGLMELLLTDAVEAAYRYSQIRQSIIRARVDAFQSDWEEAYRLERM